MTSVAIDEYELFQEGYDLYLSCQPSKAIEKFEIFLKEFPNSSAKDSVLFWLGRAMIQIGRLAESERAFNEIKTNYPDSPFNYQARKELERINTLTLRSEIDKPSEKAKISDRELIDVKSELDRLKVQAEEYKKKIEGYENRIAELSAKEKDFERINIEKARLEDRIKEIEKSNQDTTEYLKKIKDEKDKLTAETEVLRTRILNLENIKKDLVAKEALLDKKQKETESLKTEIDLLTKKIVEKEDIEKNLMKEIEAYKKNMEDYNNRLSEMVKKEAEIIIKEKAEQINQLQGRLAETERKAEELRAEKIKVTEDHNKLKEEKEKIVLDIKGKTEEIQLLKTKLSELSKREGELIKERDAANAEASDLKKRLKVLEGRASDLEKEISGKVEEAMKVREEKERLATEVMEKEKKLALMSESNKELEKKAAMVAEKEQEIKELREGLQNQRGDLERLRREKESLIKEREEVLTRLRQAEDNYNRVLKENEQLQAKFKANTDQVILQIQEKIEENKRLQNRLSETEKKAADLQAEKIKVIEDHNKLKKEKDKIALDFKEKTEEVELLKTRLLELGKREGELTKERDAANAEVLDLKKRLKVLEGRAPDINKLTDDIDRLRVLLAEEKKKHDEANSRIADLEQREKELLGLNAAMKGVMEGRLSEMGQRLQVCEKDLSGLQKEKVDREHDSEVLKKSLESLKSEVSRLRGVETEAKDALNRILQYEAKIKELEQVTEDGLKERRDLNIRLQRKDEEISRLLKEKKELETIVAKLKEKEDVSVPKSVVIGKERFSHDYVLSYMFRSQLLLSRIGIRNVPWRKGDPIEDFVSEEILYEEAKKHNFKEGWNEEFKRRFNLTKDEIEYLERFSMISNLMSHECKKLPTERSGESVIIRYSDKDKYEKVAMVADIQNRLRLGIPIKDIVKSYPDAEFRRLSDKDINELFGDLSVNFSDNEVVSTFNKERFMVIRISINPVEYRPFEVPEEETNKRLREHISNLVSAGRQKRSRVSTD